jgi:pimeloyl-ACP methyl ester carboxylesterase
MAPTTPLALTEHVPTGPDATGPVVVLIHGSLDRSASFTRVIRRLDDVHTVAYDRHGYHRSRHAGSVRTTLAGHVEDLLTVIDGRTAVVVGHSLGGDIALAAALAPGGPGPVVGVAAFEPPMPWLSLWPKPPPAPDDAGPTRPSAAEAAERFFRRMVGDDAWDRLPEAAREERRADGPALEAELNAIRSTEAPFDVTELTVPSVYGRGEKSATRHRQTVTWCVEHTPGAELVEVPGAGHGAHLTHPDAFAAMVRRLLDRVMHGAGTGAGAGVGTGDGKGVGA